MEAAIRSVALQSHVDFECVILDDQSTDGSQETIREVLAEMGDDRFRSWNGRRMAARWRP